MRGLFLLPLLCAATCGLPSLAREFDYTVSPLASDNFLEASFRCESLPGGETPSTALVFVPGTDGDGRGITHDPKFLAMAQRCHACLIGCYFRGEGLPYDDPRGGSGRAIETALRHFAVQIGRPWLANGSILLMGFSEGGMFAFNYACWHPDRLQAFAALKAIFPKLTPSAGSYLVPGLLSAGEKDDPGRIRSIANTFQEGANNQARWAFLYERGMGHAPGRDVDLAGTFFEAVCQNPSFNDSVRFDSSTGDISSEKSNDCWFPNRQIADIWRTIHEPVQVEILTRLSTPPELSSLISVECEPAQLSCKAGETQNGVLRIKPLRAGVTLEVLESSEDFLVTNPPSKLLPANLPVAFSPRKWIWGPTSTKVVIRGSLNGLRCKSAEITIPTTIEGPIHAIPATVYLGVAPAGQLVRRTLTLKFDRASTRITKIEAPSGITTSLSGGRSDHDQLVTIDWTPDSHLGRMEKELLLSVNGLDGFLRIPVCGEVVR